MKKENLKNGLMLFCFFARIGCFTFGGGFSILAMMNQEFVERRKMISKSDLLELAAMGRSLPGIMIANISMLFGCRVAGWFGGLCAVVGMTVPAVVILSLVTVFYDLLKENPWCWAALRGVTSAVVPVIGCAVLSLGKEALKQKSGLVICAATFALCAFTGISNIVLVALGVVASLIWTGVEKHGTA